MFVRDTLTVDGKLGVGFLVSDSAPTEMLEVKGGNAKVDSSYGYYIGSDCYLYRWGANLFRTDDSFYLTGILTAINTSSTEPNGVLIDRTYGTTINSEKAGLKIYARYNAVETGASAIMQGIRLDYISAYTTATVAPVYPMAVYSNLSGSSGTTPTLTQYYSGGTVGTGHTISTLTHYLCGGWSGAGSVTNYVGVRIENATGVTTTRGVHSSIASGTGKFNLYIDGTAPSHFAGQIQSTLATGTAPFSVSSTTLVSNLNAQYLNGLASSAYLQADGSVNAASLRIQGSDARLIFYETDQAAGLKRMDLIHQGSSFIARMYDDAGGSAYDWLTVTRSGSTANNITFLCSGAFTFNTHTVWHAGNDGDGSALDAGLWQGRTFRTACSVSGAALEFGGIYWDGTKWAHQNGSGKHGWAIRHGDGSGVSAGNGGLIQFLFSQTASTAVGSTAEPLTYITFDRLGLITAQRFISTYTTGSAPFIVSSTTRVDNLNVQYLNGQDGSYYLAWGNLTGKPTTVSGYGISDAVTTARQILTLHSVTGGGDLSANRTLSLVNDVASPGNNMLYGTNGSGTRGWYAIPSGGSGTVTSVGLSMPGIFSVSSSPVTVSGIIAVALVSQTANQVFAAPNGSAGAPSFRALVAADIPSLSYLSTSGGTVSGNVSLAGTVTVSNLGTDISSSLDRVLVRQSTTNLMLPATSAYLKGWLDVQQSDVSGLVSALSGKLATTGGSLSGALTINATGNGIRAAAAGSAATFFPVFTADPTAATQTIVSRTAAQVRADVGADNASNLTTGTVPSARVSGAYSSITGVGTLTSLTLSGALTINSTGNGIRAAAAGSAATHFPVFTSSPTAATVTITSRTAAEVRSDIGAASTTHKTTHETGGSDALTGNLDANARVGVRINTGASTYTRRRINFIAGTGIVISAVDDSGSEEVDVTISLA